MKTAMKDKRRNRKTEGGKRQEMCGLKQSAAKLLSSVSFCIFLASSFFLLGSCSMTKNIPEDEQLFTGLKKIAYADQQKDSFATHLKSTKEELEAALATEPNGSLFGSSYYSVPWSWHLWVYNHYSQKDTKFAKWMTKSFGKPPVLMSQVNPALRASVAKSVLRNNGYFRGDVTYEAVPQKNPKKSKIRYTVRLDTLFTLDSVAYVNFPGELQQLIDSTRQESLIKQGNAFSMSALDGERTRISSLLRNNGYYYYNPSYASYLADTLAVPNKTQLRFQLADGLPDEALRKWYIGNIDVQFRKSAREQLTDSIVRRHLTIHFNGKKSPIRPGVILRNLRVRPRQQFSYANYLESTQKINSTGVFSSTDFQFTPRSDCDTLDLRLNCVFDKPYDFYIEGNAIGRSSGRFGPELKIGVTRRNAFRGGENLDVNLHGAYEWQKGGGEQSSSYNYGADASIEFPRIIAPFYNSDRVRRDKNGRPIRRRFYSAPSTWLKVSTDIINRPEYYKMHVVTGEWTYSWQSSASSRHEFSPLTLKYQYKNKTTLKFDSLMNTYLYLFKTMDDYFIPKMRYTYIYTSPSTKRNPIRWETTVEEAGNLTSLWDLAGGHDFNEKDKKLFKNPYSQFVRIETDLTKTWSLGLESRLVGHINTGIIVTYGNSDEAPFTEQFYVGGANSIRAFAVRDIGPGSFSDRGIQAKQLFYLLRNGDLKFVANLEYRSPLFGNLEGALFLDAGNVWRVRHLDIGTPEDYENLYPDISGEEVHSKLQEWVDGMCFKPSRLLNDIALGTGVGLRYNLGFLVIRLDWGFAIHLPCDNGVSGYFFNVQRFRDLHTLHFAIGYPF
jgi:outer membrane protein assembly factor BamA